jgi:long-chain acyl-CoA synthetase
MTDQANVKIFGRSRTMAEINQQGARAATGFTKLGIVEGDIIAVLLRNDFAFLEIMAASALIGTYTVPLNWHSKPDELTYILHDAKPKILVSYADLVTPLLPVLPPHITVIVVPTPPDIAQDFKLPARLLSPPTNFPIWEIWCASFAPWSAPARRQRASFVYTSGTTGRPKGVRREPMNETQGAALRDLFSLSYGVHPGIRAFIGGPLYHASPNAFLRQSMNIAHLLVLSSKFDPESLLADIETHRLTTLVLVPTMFIRLLKLPEEAKCRYDISSLEWAFHTGAPCPPEVKRAMIDWWGPVLYETYGGTETGVVTVCSSQDWLSHPGTVGRPAPGAIIRIYSETGEQRPTGQQGEIFARSPAYADFTYHGRENDRRSIEKGGLVSCGDVGYLDEAGFLYLCDRKRDMIIAGGVNIYPAEIEAVLLTHPGIRDCAVFGIPDDDLGEAVHAAIELELNAKLDQQQIIAFAKQHLANFKTPRTIEFHDHLPRQESGKLFKRVLRDPYWAKLQTAL